ncbi:MAG: nucleotide exchange factor GrpE [Candidatus Eisenbacteria bacterium]|nr:nucleotide exchange factor GrpE [Candidatus Eisenbacteria bacterium]
MMLKRSGAGERKQGAKPPEPDSKEEKRPNSPPSEPDAGHSQPISDEAEESNEESTLERTDESTAESTSQPAAETIPLEQHQRLLAEFDNYRKRVNRERAELELRGAGNVMTRLLPLLDDFERARASLVADAVIDRQGLLIIVDQLADNLRKEGLRQIEASPGTVFDPEVHEAVLTIPTAKFPEGSVAEVLENGYRFGERLLRPARVAVARSPVPSPSQEEDTG